MNNPRKRTTRHTFMTRKTSRPKLSTSKIEEIKKKIKEVTKDFIESNPIGKIKPMNPDEIDPDAPIFGNNVVEEGELAMPPKKKQKKQKTKGGKRKKKTKKRRRKKRTKRRRKKRTRKRSRRR